MIPSTKTIAWAIVGTSTVAEQYCRQLRKVAGVRLAHVVSRREDRAAAFARKYGVERSSGTLEALLADASIDVVYLACPTRLHVEQTLMFLENGRAVLCEKPFATSLADADRVLETARQKNIFFMEGMWMRFNPLVQRAIGLAGSGDLGALRQIDISLGFDNPGSRLQDPARGALWDLGVYGISLLLALKGPPEAVACLARKPKIGPASGFSAIFRWPECTATLSCAIDANLSNEAILQGTRERLVLHSPFISPSKLTSSLPRFSGSAFLARAGRAFEALCGKAVVSDPRCLRADPQIGFFHQAQAVQDALREGATECSIVPHRDSRAVIEWAETLQQAAGFPKG